MIELLNERIWLVTIMLFGSVIVTFKLTNIHQNTCEFLPGQTLVDKELSCGRSLLDQSAMDWDPEVMTDQRLVNNSVQSLTWNPLSIKNKQTWNEESRTLIHVGKMYISGELIHENMLREGTKMVCEI